MPKIWDLMPKETKTKVMAYRHYLERTENKGGKTMTRREDKKLVFEQEDLNTVLAYVIKDNQFQHGNEMPEVVVLEIPACATGKDRNEQPYAVEIQVKQVANNEETLPPASDIHPVAESAEVWYKGKPFKNLQEALESAISAGDVLPDALANLPQEYEGEFIPKDETFTPAPSPTEDVIYYCSKCKCKHNSGKRLHKKHIRYSAPKLT